MLNLPPSLPVLDVLERYHVTYDADGILNRSCLYYGGRQFLEHQDEFLVQRAAEQKGGALGEASYEDRKKWGWYIPRAAGVIDFLNSAVFRYSPKIVCPESKFWESKNDDYDGRGTPLVQLFKDLLRYQMLNRRACLKISFPGDEGRAEDGSLDFNWAALDAQTVCDWQQDADGNLQWVRTKGCEYVRPLSAPYLPPDRERHTWIYYEKGLTTAYEAYVEIGKRFSHDDQASLVPGYPKEDDFPTLSIFALDTPESSFVMNRIEVPARKLYNIEAARTYAMLLAAHPILQANLSETEISNLRQFQMTMIKLGIDENLSYKQIDPGMFAPLREHVMEGKEEFYEVLQALTLQSLTQPQNARQSGDAKLIEAQPLKVLLEGMRQSPETVFKKSIEAAKIYRGEEDLEVRLEWQTDPNPPTLDDMSRMVIGSQRGQGALVGQLQTQVLGSDDASETGTGRKDDGYQQVAKAPDRPKNLHGTGQSHND